MDYSLPIASLMTPQVITLKETDNVYKALELFEGYHFHHLPVMGDNHELIGIVSSLDLTKANHNGETLIKDIMTPDPTVLDSDDSIGLAADIFLANAFHAIPIVEDRKLIGILTTHDLLEYAFKNPF